MSISNGKNSSDIENMDWNATGALTTVRFGSTSSQVSQNSDICRICHCESDPMNPLLTPCYCSGSLKYVHQTCLQQWLTASETNSCELCKFPFIMHTKIKPFNEWRSLDMSGVERRRLFCAVLFHCCAALCVIWSLCVLIERAAEEVHKGQIGWPFWTKLIVVTVGLTGGVVFMYIQCKQYLNLCNRWRARNRILLIQNIPEKVHPPQSPILQTFRRNAPISQGVSHDNSTIGHIQHHIYNNRHSMEAPVGSSSSGFANGAGNHCELQINQQGQIIAANIENSSMNTCDRDWTLDDISQVSFKPCPQGSGSLTPLPFHESLHNIYENNNIHRYSTISNSSNNDQNVAANSNGQNIKTNDLNLFKVANPEMSNYSRNILNATSNIKYPNSAIFLENRDILNDDSATTPVTDQLKLYHRHSTVVPDEAKLDMFIDRNLRRYSDTKLHTEDDQLLLNPKRITQALGPPVTDILFDKANIVRPRTFDPLELNIQEMLENDIRNIQRLNEHRRLHQHSLDVIYVDEINSASLVPKLKKSSFNSSDAMTSDKYPLSAREIDPVSTSAEEDNHYFSNKRKMFKSLPNLSASSENLLPTKMF